jgi:hypothetical protein
MRAKRETPGLGRFRIYKTRIGFHDWVVAAPNQKAALKAWDVRENLFAQGAAEAVHDEEAVELAMRRPGVPVALNDLTPKRMARGKR